MLRRLQVGKRDIRFILRCFSDKSSEGSGKLPELKEADNTKKSGDDTKQRPGSSTEKIQELLKQMLAEPKISEKEYREKFATASEISPRKKEIAEAKVEKIEDSLTKAAGEVAQALGGDVKHTEAELLSKVLGKINQTSTTLGDLLIGMKVDRSKEADDFSKQTTRGQQVKRFVEKAKTTDSNVRYIQRKHQSRENTGEDRPMRRSQPQVSSVNIFSGEPLGIFKKKDSTNYGTKLEVWDALNDRELTLATTQAPTNYFQKMILWTEQGKVWKFPIDNEQGIEEEQNIHFSEHVFLDAHLEGWCPKKGPIRHFMELVCVGLSKNAFYTAKEKKEHILWYKEYFESKKNLLTEVGAWEVKTSKSEAST